MSSQADSQEVSTQFDDLVHTRLPLSKVKKIAKIDPNVHMINAEAVKLMAKGTEAFVSLLAKAAHSQAVLDKRRTIQNKDINAVIKQSAIFQFLQGALEDWPEPEKVEKSKTAEGEEQGETVGEGEETMEEGETVEETEDTVEEAEDAEGIVYLSMTFNLHCCFEDDVDKENEFIPDTSGSEADDDVAEPESLPDTVPLDDSSMDHE
ncbi:hypothetical protein PMAYCL1PPCAC_06548 [Pristionchus mayeri]|uniref:Transcription factor CBF/NF-Y/archaeal histone domain-containing protein n=1 Tax=Pristionchus mayeri TaxID=1317129 RepID=A0AAN4Z8C1_9BILA|nr:hypothetical protein PMAYCL1PPCAC_06548 [Pristionchus mayeri]